MNLPLFAAFTGLGAGLWVIVLALVGYYIGNNQELVNPYLHQIALGVGGFSLFLIIGYVLISKRQGVRND